jgi:ribosomal 50S subunit-recycling heat shock protein
MRLYIMRLDKFLKTSRLIKRRTVANEACDSAHVSVNGRPAKASYASIRRVLESVRQRC